jgi:xanthine dehydrogenase YagS FAD-binding subunit
MKAFEFSQPRDVPDLIAGLTEERRPLAGGTDLITLLKSDIRRVEALLDIKKAGLPGDIQETGSGVSIGALATISDIERHPRLRKNYTLLTEAAAQTATRQLRNRATIGGNLLQAPRCWYYRHSDVQCWLKGGDRCPAIDGHNEMHAVLGESPCVAVHPSDLAGCLLALGASIRLVSHAGERLVALDDFYGVPTEANRRISNIEPNELLLSVEIPRTATQSRSTYVKAMSRKAWTFALVGVAAVIRIRQQRIEHASVVVNGVAPTPWPIVSSASKNAPLSAGELTEELTAAFRAGATALTRNAYKIPLTCALLKKAIESMVERKA